MELHNFGNTKAPKYLLHFGGARAAMSCIRLAVVVALKVVVALSI
jgi:hypothetical protein